MQKSWHVHRVCLYRMAYPHLQCQAPSLGVREELGLLRQTNNDHNLAGERS
jgi:hypothetical protein